MIYNLTLLFSALGVVSFIFYLQKKKKEQKQLIEACIKGDLELVKLLINQGKYLDIVPAFKTAISHGHIDIVKFLFEKGVDIKNYYNYMRLACESNNKDGVRFLMENKVYCVHSCFNWIIKYDHLDLFKIYLNDGNYFDFEDISPVITYERLNMVKVLLEKELINASEILEEACKQGKIEIVEYLMSNPDITEEELNKSFHIAIKYQRVNIVRFLVERRGCRLYEEYADNYSPVARTILISQIFNPVSCK